MKVYKFGGASVKDAESIKNVARIVGDSPANELCIVVSAMGKTTNALEAVTKSYFHRKSDAPALLEQIKQYHYTITKELFGDDQDINDQLNNVFIEIEWVIEDEPNGSYDFIYDQIVSQGEMLSTLIVNHHLEQSGIPAVWIDARDLIRTDNHYREGNVDWQVSADMVNQAFARNPGKVVVTQGFIGGTSENYTTTLGREGSDYTAAILAHLLKAENVTIWKDVPGVLNADPKWFSDCVLIREMSYQDALELAYYGASVIHPKTIKPLQNSGIPLYVRSFLNPGEPCTEISIRGARLPVPGYIFKRDQVLVSLSPRDFSFIAEENLRDIFSLLTRHRVRMNLMQNSALSFSFCADYEEDKVVPLLKDLGINFQVRYNQPVELITIRNGDEATHSRLLADKDILLDVRSRNTVQVVARPAE